MSGQTDVTKLTVAFQKFVNSHKNWYIFFSFKTEPYITAYITDERVTEKKITAHINTCLLFE